MGFRASEGSTRPENEAATAPSSIQPGDGRPAVADPPALPPESSPAAAQATVAAGPSETPVTSLDERALTVVMRDVTHRFGDVLAIRGITLGVAGGTILGVIGPSGSGKTTTIRHLTGSLAPTAGTVRVLGEDPRRFRARTRERIGYMPQHFLLYPDLTAGENVDFVAALFGLLFRRRRRRVREVLTLVDLWDVRGRRASQLSGGMQRRLELACALVHEPQLLLLDEPTAGIDPMLRQTIWDELQRLRDAGRTLLVTTQYVGEAEQCDQVALIAGGELIALGSPADLRRQALGGERLRVETDRPTDSLALPAIEGVLRVERQGPREMIVVTDDVGEVTPRIVDALSDQGVTVTSTREERPSFDEVFARLVATHDERVAGSDAAARPEEAHDAAA